MKYVKSRTVIAVLSLALSLTHGGAAEKPDQEQQPGKKNQQRPAARPKQGQGPVRPGQERPAQRPGQDQPPARENHESQPERREEQKEKREERPEEQGNRATDQQQHPKLETKAMPDGGYVKTTPSGQVRERAEKRADGEHIQHFSPTGRKQIEEVHKADTSVQRTHYDLGGRVTRQESVAKDGSREVSNQQVGRNGNVHAKETVKYDVNNRAVSKTVEKNVNVTINKTVTVNKTVVVNHYDRGRFGFVYRPLYVGRPHLFISWYDPFWYTPAGILIVHPFHFAWGWEGDGWYHRYHGPYWATYDVYPAPSYWVTDWMVAGYVADHYETQITADQAREEARLAREEAENARRLAQEAKDQAEIAEAKAAQAQAELRAKNAEDRAVRLERDDARVKELAGKPNPNATPIDQDTKETLKTQIEKTIAEKKQFAEQTEKGSNPPLPDVSTALADLKHIYPVSKLISVTSAKDSNPAGTLSEGDLLRVEPGQEAALRNATENTFVTMRVMTSKGEEGEVTAGTLINVAIKDLQDFDNEFRSKLDVGLSEAEKNKDLFKQGVIAR